MSIPDDTHRRKGAKGTDLVKEKLPSEKALGINWNVS